MISTKYSLWRAVMKLACELPIHDLNTKISHTILSAVFPFIYIFLNTIKDIPANFEL